MGVEGVGLLQGSRQHPGRADPPAVVRDRPSPPRKTTSRVLDRGRRVVEVIRARSFEPRSTSVLSSTDAAELVEHQQEAEARRARRPRTPTSTGKWRLTQPSAPLTGRARGPTTRNGKPRPSEYAASSVAARPARGPAFAAMPRIEPRIGPRHGDHPNPNATPATNGAAVAVTGRAAGGSASPGTATARAGTTSRAGTAPSPSMIAPEMRVSSSWWSRNGWPIARRGEPEQHEHACRSRR